MFISLTRQIDQVGFYVNPFYIIALVPLTKGCKVVVTGQEFNVTQTEDEVLTLIDMQRNR
ncbi:MAG: hypothetical protein JNJ91_05220 [Flavobacteriales bacterium]|nr:hypothetical protein [Flavobacteriales bacterium]